MDVKGSYGDACYGIHMWFQNRSENLIIIASRCKTCRACRGERLLGVTHMVMHDIVIHMLFQHRSVLDIIIIVVSIERYKEANLHCRSGLKVRLWMLIIDADVDGVHEGES